MKILITKDNFNYQLIEDTKVEPLYQGYNCIIEEKVFYAKQLAKTGFYKLDGLYFNTSGVIFQISENNQYNGNYNPLNLFVMSPTFKTHNQTNNIRSCGFYYIKRNKQEVFDKRKLKSKTPWKTEETLFYTDTDYSFLQEYKGFNYINPSSYVIFNGEIYKKPEYDINNSILEGKDSFIYESWYSRYYGKKNSNPTYHIKKTSDSSWLLKDVIDKREEGFDNLFN